jgi:hypothetical protein
MNTQHDTVSRAMKAVLPAELIDQVIDHLHDDVLALRACCLTSREWLPGARFHIFHDVLLSSPDRADAFVKLLVTWPHLSHFIQCLIIQGDAYHIYAKLDYLDTVLPMIAPKLTRLRSLRVDNVTLAYANPKVLSALIHHFPALKEIYLSSVTFDRFRDFAALVVAHPLIERLGVGRIWWNGSMKETSRWEYVLQSYPDSRSRLRHVSLNDTAADVLDWILSHYRVLPIHTVTHSTISASLVPHMARFFHALGPSLEHLTFSIQSIESPLELHGSLHIGGVFLHMLTPFLDLEKASLISSNTRLRGLTFDSLLLIQRTSYAWIPILLSQVTSLTIEEINFVVVCNKPEILGALDLERIQDVLTMAPFSRLERVVFRLVGSIDPVEGGREIWRRMDLLAGRGLLVLHQEGNTGPISFRREEVK